MADWNANSNLVLDDIFGTLEFLTSLIANLSLSFENNKWQIRYGRPK